MVIRLSLAICLTLGFVQLLSADADSAPGTAPVEKPEYADSEPPTKPNLQAKTLGGREFWGDVRHFHDWRIQHNVIVAYSMGGIVQSEPVINDVTRFLHSGRLRATGDPQPIRRE